MREDFSGRSGREGGSPVVLSDTTRKFLQRGATAAIGSWKLGQHDTAIHFQGGDV